jgi:hypothetical protein
MRRLIENFSTFTAGVIIGALGVVVHNFSIGWFPLGLIAALVGSFAATRVIGIYLGRRGVRLWFLLGWTFIALRGGIFGNSDELLIMSNGAGNAFLGLGFLLVLVGIWARI